MPETHENQRFFYRASAFALGGEISRPFRDVLEVQAATSLPTIGGYGSAHAGKFRYRELVSFENAYSQVMGSSHGLTRDSLATATVEGLNIMDIVTADKVVARLTSTYAFPSESAKSGGARDHPSLLPVGSYFVNLRIAGVPVNPLPHDVLLRKGKFADLEQEYETTNSPFVDPNGKTFCFPKKLASPQVQCGAEGGAAHPRFEDCYVLTSIFKDPVVKDPSLETEPGGCVEVEGFGRICLGEFLITSNSRRLTMIVCHFGSVPAGRLAAGGVEGNGSGY